MGSQEVGLYTSCLESWPTRLLRTWTVLSEKPRHQLALPPFMGFPPGMNHDSRVLLVRPKRSLINQQFITQDSS